MTTIEMQSSLARMIYAIDDITLLQKIKDSVRGLISKTEKTEAKDELTPMVRKMCCGHSLDTTFSDDDILTDALMRKHL